LKVFHLAIIDQAYGWHNFFVIVKDALNSKKMKWYSLYKFVVFYAFKLMDYNSPNPENQVSRKSKISAVELKRLLVNIHSYTQNICIRCRPIGEMWMKNHARVSSINGPTALLYDEKETKYYMVNVNKVMQFDLDERFQNYQPHHHYDVEPSPELD
jgi:hypothetical protein